MVVWSLSASGRERIVHLHERKLQASSRQAFPSLAKHTDDWYATTAPENKYQYNGKELNEELGLNWMDYEARMYDASIARFTGVDPIVDEAGKAGPDVKLTDGEIEVLSVANWKKKVADVVVETTVSVLGAKTGEFLDDAVGNIVNKEWAKRPNS
ncbi:MAG: hypothetical protein MK226_15435 [Saprospiraceae bacterium]|nr:hypothetical protein [Saprospiraceae bacterium]